MTESNNHGHDSRVSEKMPARVTPTTKVNVAFPFSQVKVQEPSVHLVTLTELVADLAGLVADIAPGPETNAVRRRAHNLASMLR